MDEPTRRSTNLLKSSSILTTNCMNEPWRKSMMKNLKEGLKPIRGVYHHRILEGQVSIEGGKSTSMLVLYQWNWTPQYVITKGRIPRLDETIWRKIRRVIHVANRATSLKIVVREEWCLNDKSTLCWERYSMNEIRKISTQIIRRSRKSSRMMNTFELRMSRSYDKFWTKKSQAQHLHQHKK